MNTTFDELYALFIRNTKVNNLELPNSVDGQIQLIQSAIMEFNIRFRIGYVPLKADDISETLSEELDDALLMFLVECMTLVVYKNMLSDYISTWETYQADIGRKYYKDQLNGRQYLVEMQEKRLSSLKLAISDDFVDEF